MRLQASYHTLLSSKGECHRLSDLLRFLQAVSVYSNEYLQSKPNNLHKNSIHVNYYKMRCALPDWRQMERLDVEALLTVKIALAWYTRRTFSQSLEIPASEGPPWKYVMCTIERIAKHIAILNASRNNMIFVHVASHSQKCFFTAAGQSVDWESCSFTVMTIDAYLCTHHSIVSVFSELNPNFHSSQYWMHIHCTFAAKTLQRMLNVCAHN